MTLIEALKATLRRLHYSPRTEEAYVHWTREFLRFHRRHPREMGAPEIQSAHCFPAPSAPEIQCPHCFRDPSAPEIQCPHCFPDPCAHEIQCAHCFQAPSAPEIQCAYCFLASRPPKKQPADYLHDGRTIARATRGLTLYLGAQRARSLTCGR